AGLVRLRPFLHPSGACVLRAWSLAVCLPPHIGFPSAWCDRTSAPFVCSVVRIALGHRKQLTKVLFDVATIVHIGTGILFKSFLPSVLDVSPSSQSSAC